MSDTDEHAEYYIDAEQDFWRKDPDGTWYFHDGPWRQEGYRSPGADRLPAPEDAAVHHTDPESQPLRRLQILD